MWKLLLLISSRFFRSSAKSIIFLHFFSFLLSVHSISPFMSILGNIRSFPFYGTNLLWRQILLKCTISSESGFIRKLRRKIISIWKKIWKYVFQIVYNQCKFKYLPWNSRKIESRKQKEQKISFKLISNSLYHRLK